MACGHLETLETLFLGPCDIDQLSHAQLAAMGSCEEFIEAAELQAANRARGPCQYEAAILECSEATDTEIQSSSSSSPGLRFSSYAEIDMSTSHVPELAEAMHTSEEEDKATESMPCTAEAKVVSGCRSNGSTRVSNFATPARPH